MIRSFDGYNDIIRLEYGEQLMDSIQRFIGEEQMTGAWLQGVGAASNIIVGFYNLGTKEYKWRTFGQMMEVVSLTGNIAFDINNLPVIHLHGIFASDEFDTIGGHIKDFTVGATLELFVHRTYKPLRRIDNVDIGLPLLDWEK